MTATLSPPKPQTFPKKVAPVESHQRWRVTREEYYRLNELGFFEGKRVERIHGEIFVMSPVGWKHAITVSSVWDTLRDRFGKGYFIIGQSTYSTQDSDPEPDVTVVVGKQRDYQKDPGNRALVVEVSDSSLRFDLGKKAYLYSAAGVLDYWVVDLVNLRVIVFRDPKPDETSESGFSYATRSEYVAGQSIVPLAAPNGASVAVADLLP